MSKNTRVSKGKNYEFKHEFDKDLDVNIYFKPSHIDKINLPLGYLPIYSIEQTTEPLDELEPLNKTYYIKTLYSFEGKGTNYKKKLYHLLTYKIKDNLEAIHVIDNLFKEPITCDDQTIYKLIKPHIQQVDESKRGQFRINSIIKYIDLKDFNPTYYLDLGCFKGEITTAVGKHFNLNKHQINGLDINDYPKNDDINDKMTFTLYDGNTIPFSDNSFDLITCFMLLHHIPPSKLDNLIKELSRVMKPGGILLLREHDVHDKEYDMDKNMLDLLHEYYDHVLNTSENEQWHEIETYYHSEKYWSNKLISNGFKYHCNSKIIKNARYNPFYNYIYSYVKVDQQPKLYQTTLDRILKDDAPEEQYYRRSREVKHFIHWGQRKLLLSEIEFLTLFISDHDEKNNIVVIYAGAADGKHIKFLSSLFPKIKFILYDPNNFDERLYNIDMIEIHQEYFTNEVALQLFNRLDTNNPTYKLLISDIRTADINKMSPSEVEACVKMDHNMQKEWYEILQPDMTMLKFRLPWDCPTTDYLEGDIYLQAYAPLSSTETRLIINGHTSNIITYDNKKYENQLFYFNKYTRETSFSNILLNIPLTERAGLTNTYDSCSEIIILKNYLKLIHLKDVDNLIKSHDIIKLSKDISVELGRSLCEAQPLNQYKKNIWSKLIQLDLVPNLKPTITNYNLYVLPIYDKLIYDKIISE